ncbi:KN motif and ankyrin repeat domain-containing protein 2-like isoform X2 [Homalodisca vitripennis]|uniref:KN motif and ankyrin repeat domain-containing protein 2-like isoform X2 n=1 Tax=Homalodisca vitripennis TaxID=197043 RepID=UPI001EE9D437|nr:KN motif and ankyrin repeat domain-containing protein 2-like isoform X2 [Homalodisca vitripennis]
MSSMVNNTLPRAGPITNGLVNHKSGDDWGNVSLRRKSKYMPCDCCPYGYHIDLDFVRFCETLAQGGSGDTASKQRRKERRRQRKSMEVLLGLNSPPTWSSDRDVPQFFNEPLKEGEIFKYDEENGRGYSPVRDELQKAVLDFEDTLQRSRCSTLRKHQDVADLANSPLQSSELQDLENGNNASGLGAGALQNIREQMAQSLERMKELEEQVKVIPVLQVQLSVLKDEKRRLLESLRLSQTRQDYAIEKITNNTTNNNKYYTLPLASDVKMKSSYVEEVAVTKKASMRDVSLSCVAMTRDVGVSHSEPPVVTCDVGVNYNCPRVPTRDVGTSHVTLPVSTRDVGVCHTDLPESFSKNVPSQQVPKEMVSLKTIITKPQVRDNSMVTDLLHNQVYSDIELDKNINKAIKMFEKTFLHKLQRNKIDNAVSIGVQTLVPSETLKITEKSDKGVQVVKEKQMRDFGINHVPRTSDVQVSFRPETRDIGVSDDTTEIQCEKCISEAKTLVNINDNYKQLSLASLNVVRSKSFDYSDRSPLRKPRTRSVACGPLLRITGTKSCDTSDLMGRSKDVGVNTVKRKLVDAAVGESSQKPSSVNVCDKCSNTITNFAKDILNQSREHLVPATLVSRIPRPTTLPQLNSPDKPKLTRQDTYTKTFAVPLTQTSPADPPTRAEPSKEMRAAMKVLNDALLKSPNSNPPPQMKNAINIIQQEWFKISSTASANPLDVEDYLDCLEEMSGRLLEYVVNMTDVSGNTAMHYAVSHGNFDVVSILLDSKVCNINQTNAAGYTCIMLVSLAQVRSETHRQVVRRLFQMADVNIRAKQHGQTALMLAVSHGRLDMVELLLQSGADMNIQDEDGSTALMCAAEHHHIEIVRLLLAQPDCDLSIRDYDGSTALNIAMEAGNRDIGVLLYAQEHFSRGSSPHTSLKHRRPKSTTPTLRTPTSPQPRTKQDHSF